MRSTSHCLILLPLLTLSGACASDQNLSAVNQVPLITLQSPLLAPGEDALRVDVGAPEGFAVIALDAEDPSTELGITWSAVGSPEDIDLGQTIPDSSGWSENQISGLPVGNWYINARVTDSDGATAETGLAVEVLEINEAPLAEIAQPTDGAVIGWAEELQFVGTVSDDRGLDGLTLSWFSDINGILDSTPPSDTGLTSFSRTDLVPGLHTVTLRVEDADGLSATATVIFSVLAQNQPPTAPEVQLLPEQPGTLDDLYCWLPIGSADPEGLPIDYVYTWYREGQPTLWVDPTLPAEQTLRGDTWTCEVYATDLDLSSPVGSDTVTIGNTPPSLGGIDLGPSPAYEDSVLLCEATGWSDADGDPEGYLVAWLVDGNPVPGATSSNLEGASFDAGQLVRCELTPNDGFDVGVPLLSGALAINNSTPSTPMVNLSPSPSAASNVPLDCQLVTASIDADGDPLIHHVQWLVDGVHVPAFDELWVIPAAETALGEGWLCEVWADDGQASSALASASTTVLPAVGDLVISEFLATPLGVSDADGEWVEIYNASDAPIDLQGFELSDDVADSHVIAASVVVPSAGRVVLARNADLLNNGGVVAAYEYEDFVLGDISDAIILSVQGLEIDRVDYDLGALPVSLSGRSVSYDGALGAPDALTNDDPGSWCAASTPQAGFGGDFGTPGFHNDDCTCSASDSDGDGFGADGACSLVDCDDSDAAINPAAIEQCENGVDEDCSGADELCDCLLSDLDGDNYGTGASCPQIDCDDGDDAVFPGALEICNGIDDDCGGDIDEPFDTDGDGESSCGGDCNDANALIFSAAVEICDALDNNCDGDIDEGFDGDGDGFTLCAGDCDDGDETISPAAIEICDTIDNNCVGGTDEGFDLDADGYTSCAGDCNDSNATVFPGQVEVCNVLDDDCDGSVDEGFDGDGDGFSSCAGDCDDGDSAVHPAALEICDGLDNNCVAGTDEGFDVDGDGFTSCTSDCNDADPAIHSGATESCDAVDSDCDGDLVDGFADFDGDGAPDCIDLDDDADGDPDATDCADLDPTRYNGAAEISCNGIDEDCDGSDSCADPCVNYGGTSVTINANIQVCNNPLTWGAWNNTLIPGSWQVCTLAQWATYAPSASPSSFGLATIWIDNNSCGVNQHHEIYDGYPMNQVGCYDGADCCWADSNSLQFAVCSP